MASYPYILKTGTLKKFMERIPQLGTPDKVTNTYIYGLGFKSVNDRPLLKILKFLDLTDQTGTPTDYYRQYRDQVNGKKVLGVRIRDAYSDVFKVFPDADRQDNETLRNYFSTHSGLGARAAKSIVDTFKTLCSLAEFSDEFSEIDQNPLQNPPPTTGPANNSAFNVIERSFGEGRKAKIITPEDISPEEIDKVIALLNALK